MARQITLCMMWCLILVIIRLYSPSHAFCGPSQLISKLIATSDAIRTECGRTFPICVYDCKWTAYTCNALEKQQRWSKNSVVLSNVTKLRDNSIERKCCKSSSIMVANCHSVQWSIGDLFKSGRMQVYSVQQFANAQCQSRLAFVRDITRNKANIALEICCFSYKEARMICRSKGGAVVNDAALVSGSVATSLALGIGVPLLLSDCRRQFTVVENTDAVCGFSGIEKFYFTTNEECCQICARVQDRTFCVYSSTEKKCYIRKCTNGHNLFPNDKCISYIPK